MLKEFRMFHHLLICFLTSSVVQLVSGVEDVLLAGSENVLLVGCYADLDDYSLVSRLSLTDQFGLISSVLYSSQECITACREEATTYAGIRFTAGGLGELECVCGNLAPRGIELYCPYKCSVPPGKERWCIYLSTERTRTVVYKFETPSGGVSTSTSTTARAAYITQGGYMTTHGATTEPSAVTTGEQTPGETRNNGGGTTVEDNGTSSTQQVSTTGPGVTRDNGGGTTVEDNGTSSTQLVSATGRTTSLGDTSGTVVEGTWLTDMPNMTSSTQPSDLSNQIGRPIYTGASETAWFQGTYRETTAADVETDTQTPWTTGPDIIPSTPTPHAVPASTTTKSGAPRLHSAKTGLLILLVLITRLTGESRSPWTHTH